MMRLLPENRSKALVSVFLLLLLTAGIVYINFLLDKGSAPAPGPQADLAAFEGGLLPYGSKIKTQILNDDEFKVLKGVPPITVSAEELGKPNLFESQ